VTYLTILGQPYFDNGR